METVQLDTGLFRSRAENGLTVLTERMPGARSAAVGFWVRAASAHETPAHMGVSHLLEHMVFKGTERRTAQQIALELEVRGGSLDAYTGRDHTSFQAHILDSDLPVAIGLLTDLVRRPLLRDADLVPERNVVLEEINGVLDTPDDFVFELLSETMWNGHPYGYSILGTPDSVRALTAADLRDRHRWGYYPANVVCIAAGNVDHAVVLERLTEEGWLAEHAETTARPPIAAAKAARGVERREHRDTTQAHIVFGTDTFAYTDERRYALSILTNTFGGGMSSRLFQHMREELGLAYNVYAYHQLYQAAGVCGVYIGTQPGTASQAMAAIREQFDLLAAKGLSSKEVADGKRQLRGQVILALETPHSRMTRLATIELYGEPYRSVEDTIRRIDAVAGEEVAALAAEYYGPSRQTMVCLGPQ